MKSLMIIMKWINSCGYDSNEINFLDYMKTKNFVLIKKDDEYCFTEDLISNLKDMKLNPDNYFDEDFQPKIVVGETYFYKERMFCKESKAFLNFIKKVKKYYQKKIKNYKSIRSLEYRRIHGKFPKLQ